MTIKLNEEINPELDYDLWYHTIQNGHIEKAKIIQKLLLKKYRKKHYPDLYKLFKNLPERTMAISDLSIYDVYQLD